MNSSYNRNTQKERGMTLSEMLVVVAAAAVIITVTVPIITDVKNNAQTAKLKTDVATLNTAVREYIASGGQMNAEHTASEILEFLKAEMSANDAASHVGFTGSLVDSRLMGRPMSSDEDGPRAVWSWDQKRFIITTDNVEGIEMFVLDENAEKITSNRESYSIVRYSTDEDDEWIWKYGEDAKRIEITPTNVTTNPNVDQPTDPILIDLNPLDDATPPQPPVEEPPAEDPNRLAPPVFTITGGNYALNEYRLPLVIENPNTTVDSEIYYRYSDGVTWLRYTDGHVLNIGPDTALDAFVFSFDPVNHPHSTLASSSYQSDPVQLNLSLTTDSNSVSYWDMMNGDVRVRWNVTNLDAVPDYMKTAGFFSSYYTIDGTDPGFPANRLPGDDYAPGYNGDSILLNPSLWNGGDVLEIAAYAESADTTWIHHSEKPAVSIMVSKETLPSPEISLEQVEPGIYQVTMTPSGDMPPNAKIYYNAVGETMEFDQSNGQVAKGVLYSEPFIWEPETDDDDDDSGASGSVNIDTGDGDIPIQQVVLRTNGNDVVQDQSISFDVMERPGANTMRGATVNDDSNSEITLESITINDNGNVIVADNVNVLEVTVSNLNYPDANLNRVTAYENGVKLGDANDSDFGEHIQNMLSSRDLRDYIKYDGNNGQLSQSPYDFHVNFSPLNNDDYLVVMERYGNSTFDLEPLDASGNVISGSNKLVIREYSWNTGFAPSDSGSQPFFFAVVDIEKFGVDTDRNSITGFRVNNDGGADFKFFTISDTSFENRPVNYEGDLTAAAYPPADLTNWFSQSQVVSVSVDGQIPGGNDDPGNDGNGHSNNGHGNNEDGVDVSNPGQGHGGPNGEEDPSGDVDDESGSGSGSNNSDNTSDSNQENSSSGNGNNGNGHSNNGHGNNEDGVDVSNPGQGNGGPNGEEDPSGDVDDESGPGNGNGSNGNGNNGKGKGNN